MQRLTQFLVALGCTLVLGTGVANAADFPDRPVRIIVGAAPGSSTDILPRLLATQLQKFWGQPAVVENKPGADGAIGAEFVKNSKPDGYTLYLSPSAFTIVASQGHASYDPVKDFAPVILLGRQPYVFFASPALKVNSLQAFIDLARSKPGLLNFSSTGPVSPAALAIESLTYLTKTKMVNVSYTGGAPMIEAVVKNETQLAALSLQSVGEQINAGMVVPLAVAASARLAPLPNVPTVEEAIGLKGFEIGSWAGVVAPAGTPPDVIARLHDGFVGALKTPEVQTALEKVSFITIAGSPQQFGQFMVQDLALWTDLIKNISAK